MIERDRAILIIDSHQALREPPLTNRDIGPALALKAQCIDIGAGDSLHRRYRVTANALMRLRMDVLQVPVPRSHAHRAHARLAFFGGKCGGV